MQSGQSPPQSVIKHHELMDMALNKSFIIIIVIYIIAVIRELGLMCQNNWMTKTQQLFSAFIQGTS